MRIKICITGGTFDKEYDEITGKLYFNDTHIYEMLKLGRSNVEVVIETLFMMDSLEMGEAQRKVIVQSCLDSTEDMIIVTHGTDTMAETANYLFNHISNKTVVLTGAMIPYKFGSSDGLFNLGCALAFVQTLPKGVYIAMNGQHFSAGKVRKNKKEGLFEAC